MKTVKLIAIILLLAMIALFAFGCGESLTYTFYVDDVGEVHCDYLFRYDAESSDADTVKSQAMIVMKTFVENNGYNDYAVISTDTVGEVSLKLTFPSLTDYYIAIGYTGREENEVNKTSKVGLFNRYDFREESYLTENNIAYVRALTSAEYRDFPLDCDFYYTYGTTSKMTRSNGEVREENGIYYHTWKLEYGEPADILISKYGINGWIVFSAAISLFVLSLVVIFVIIFIKHRKNKRFYVAMGDAESEEVGESEPTE